MNVGQTRSISYNAPNRLCCDRTKCESGTDVDIYGPCGKCIFSLARFRPCSTDPSNYANIATEGGCIVPADKLSRRQLVSFTVPNPMASSSASSRRRMDEETGAAESNDKSNKAN